jgi:F-type H+-transporting ATPase subunit b
VTIRSALVAAALLGLATLPVAAQEHKAAPPVEQHAPKADTAAPGQHAPAPAGAPHAQPQGEHAAAAEGDHAGPSIWSFIAKLVNFAILAGTLVYFLRDPLSQYVTQRGQQVRHELVTARELKATATAQLAAIDQRLQALPGELDALRTRGAQETAAEEARIRQAAAAERERLIEQTRRDIDAQLRVARRELMHEASTLAVGVARARLQSSLTPADQLRLVDRYTSQVEQHHD